MSTNGSGNADSGLVTYLTNGSAVLSDQPGRDEAPAAAEESAEFEDFYLRAQFITGLVCYPILCILGMTGNVLSFVVLSQPKMSSSTNTFLVALSVSDSIKLINDTLYFFVILLLRFDPPTGNAAYVNLYPYAHYLFHMSTCTTAWLTVSVAAERYIMVCHATRARQLCNIPRARLVSFLVFVLMSLLSIPMALRYHKVRKFMPEFNETVMTIDVTELWDDDAFSTSYNWILNVIRLIAPLAILCTLNYFIIVELRRMDRKVRRRNTSRYRVTLTLIAVIILFVVCVIPDAVMSTVFGFGYTDDDSYLVRGIREITDMLLTVNAAFNFILYCTFNTVFRANFMALFCGKQYAGRLTASETVHLRRNSCVTVMNGNVNKTVVGGEDVEMEPML